jgi:GTPase Era involved in 16S rRNA processing
MRDRIVGLLERADLALASSAGVIDEQSLTPFVETVRAVRTRIAYPEDVLVVALAGGTGSGKSSIFNVLCGEELVDVGGMRPTTSHPAAAVPERLGGAFDGYLDSLGIEERHTHSGELMCLIDLPDTDSVEVDHRLRVDAVLGLVDLVVWVTDPEKYRDARLHHDYLRPLAPYAEQFVFVMNQVDRLSPVESEAVCHDLAEALAGDGLGEIEVIPVAASPPSGPPVGIERLREVLAGKDREVLFEKLLTDLAATASALEGMTGPSLDFDSRAAVSVEAAVGALSAGSQPDAVAALTEFLDAIELETGGPLAERIAGHVADVPAHVRRIAGELAPAPAPRRWRRAKEQPFDSERARSLLSEAAIRPVRALLAKRALALAAVAELGVDIEAARAAR